MGALAAAHVLRCWEIARIEPHLTIGWEGASGSRYVHAASFPAAYQVPWYIICAGHPCTRPLRYCKSIPSMRIKLAH